jgi:hypothetical protein
MNLYRVISEELGVTIPILDDGSGPEEPYRIAHLVAAESPAAAKWAAWKSDRHSFEDDPREMPKFSVYKVKTNIDLTAGFYDSDERFSDCWD